MRYNRLTIAVLAVLVRPNVFADSNSLKSIGASSQPLASPLAAVVVRPPGDCSEIQRAVDRLPPVGGEVFVRAGIYTCTEPVVIDRDNVVLRGEGLATKLSLAPNSNSPVIVVGSANTPPPAIRRNIYVSDIFIEGNRAGQTMECWGGPCDSGGRTFIRNNGVTIRGAVDVRIERVTVARARSGGLVSERVTSRLTVKDFTTFDNQFDGVAAYQTSHSLFQGIKTVDNLAGGFSFDIDFNNNIVSDAVVVGNRTVGVFMRDSRDNMFHGLQISGSGEHGVFLAQVDSDPSKPAAGNTFVGLVVWNSQLNGMRVNDASCVHNMVVGSQFIGNKLGCISEATVVQKIGIICR